ncbi:MAG: hypothetical protein HYR84_02805, partial [Planctomycetes bacterium]|nr:hypothetical protein [Planctomycetota bacterium]
MMSRAALGVVVLALFSARAEDVEPDAPAGVACKGQRSDTDRAYLRVPLHGTLFKGKLHGFFGIQNEKPITSWRQFNLIAVDPRNPDIGKGGEYHFIGRRGFGCRHRIAFGSLWMMQHPGNLVRLKIDELHLFDFLNPDRQKQYAAKYPRGAKPPFGPNLENHSFWLLSLFNRYHIITPASNMVPQPKEVLGFGAVPTSATSCKSYILNAATQQIEAWDSDFVWDDQKVCWEPKPSQQSAKIDQWIKDLDNSIIQRRLQASLELQALGQIARPALEKFIASKPSAEASRR